MSDLLKFDPNPLTQRPNPQDYIAVCVLVPNSQANIEAFLRQIIRMGRWTEWERDSEGNAAYYSNLWQHALDDMLPLSLCEPSSDHQDPDCTSPVIGGSLFPLPHQGDCIMTHHCSCGCNQSQPLPFATPLARGGESFAPQPLPVPSEIDEDVCRVTQYLIHLWVQMALQTLDTLSSQFSLSNYWAIIQSYATLTPFIRAIYRAFIFLAGLLSSIGVITDTHRSEARQLLLAIDRDRGELSAIILSALSSEGLVASVEAYLVRLAAGIDPRLAAGLAYLFAFFDLSYLSEVSEYIGLVPDDFVAQPCTIGGGGGTGTVITLPPEYRLIATVPRAVIRGNATTTGMTIFTNGDHTDDAVVELTPPANPDTGMDYPLVDRRGYVIQVASASTTSPLTSAFVGTAANTGYIMSEDYGDDEPVEGMTMVYGHIPEDTVLGSYLSETATGYLDTDARTDEGSMDGFLRVQTGDKFAAGAEESSWVLDYRAWWIVYHG